MNDADSNDDDSDCSELTAAKLNKSIRINQDLLFADKVQKMKREFEKKKQLQQQQEGVDNTGTRMCTSRYPYVYHLPRLPWSCEVICVLLNQDIFVLGFTT